MSGNTTERRGKMSAQGPKTWSAKKSAEGGVGRVGTKKTDKLAER